MIRWKSLKICLFYIGLTVSIFSCGSPGNNSGVYSKEEMVRILMDIHLAEARIEASGYRNIDSARKDYKKLEKEVFKKYKIDSAKYHRSFEFYSKNLELFDEIYTVIRDSFQIQDSLLKLNYPQSTPDRPVPETKTNDTLKPKVNRKKLQDLKVKSSD